MCTSITRIIYSCRRLTKQPRSSSFMPPKILSLFRRIVVRRWQWRRGAGMKWQKKGENDRGGKERGEDARHVSARRDHYIKRPITINSEDAVYRSGTRKGINPRGLSADTAIMKRIGLLSVPEVRPPKVQSSMTAMKISLRTPFAVRHSRYVASIWNAECGYAISCVITSWHFERRE